MGEKRKIRKIKENYGKNLKIEVWRKKEKLEVKFGERESSCRETRKRREEMNHKNGPHRWSAKLPSICYFQKVKEIYNK